ncbi:hypothetical protein FQZ97_917480 [compost metagenome]
MQRLDARVVDVDELQVVQLLQQEVRGVVVDAAAGMVVDALQKHLEGGAVEQVFARMQFEADVAVGVFKGVEDRQPALGEFVECGFNQAGRTRWPGVQKRPGQRAGKAHVALETQTLGSLGGQDHLLHRPGLAGLGVLVHGFGGEAVKRFVVGRVHRHQLPLQVGAELGDGDAVFARHARHLVAIGLRFGGFVEVKNALVP